MSTRKQQDKSKQEQQRCAAAGARFSAVSDLLAHLRTSRSCAQLLSGCSTQVHTHQLQEHATYMQMLDKCNTHATFMQQTCKKHARIVQQSCNRHATAQQMQRTCKHTADPAPKNMQNPKSNTTNTANTQQRAINQSNWCNSMASPISHTQHQYQ